jgi:nitrate/nitrite-specific signal transduction histidine kinase
LLTSILRAFEQYKLQEENTKLYVELQKRNAELQDLAKNLEEKVAARTRDLELKNRALLISQNIMSMLPVGVIGVDSYENVVYMNSSLPNFINADDIRLGLPMGDTVPEEVVSALNHSMKQMKTIYTTMEKENALGIICTPLPSGKGAIGVFVYLDMQKYGQFYNFGDK